MPSTQQRDKVAIIIVTYNAPRFVALCLDSVRRYSTMPYQLIVVDNASEQSLRDYLAEQKDIRLIQNEENRLWCAGCNQGIQAADEDVTHYMLLNSDMEVRRADWLQRMVNLLNADERIVMVGTAQNHVRVWPTFGSVDGQCMMLKRSLIEEIGLLDCQRFPWNGSEVDLAARAFKRGYRYKLLPPEPELVVHYHGMSRHQSGVSLKKVGQRVDAVAILSRAGLRPVSIPRWLWTLYKHLPGCPFYKMTRTEQRIARGRTVK